MKNKTCFVLIIWIIILGIFQIIKVGDKAKYPEPKIGFIIGTWISLEYENSKVLHEISSTPHNKEKSDGRKISIISWYLYTYTYEDLWVKIITSPLYEPYFFEKTEKKLIQRSGNILHPMTKNSRIVGKYIEVILKDPNTSFEDEIRENHLSSWCAIQTGIVQNGDWIEKHMNWFQAIRISSMDGNLFGDENCTLDKQFPDNLSDISFYMDPKKSDRYYKFSLDDACAPWPCSIFWDIEFF